MEGFDIGFPTLSAREAAQVLERDFHLHFQPFVNDGIGEYYSWSEQPDGHGISYRGIRVHPTRYVDEEGEYIPRAEWKKYGSVALISEGRPAEMIRAAVRNGWSAGEVIEYTSIDWDAWKRDTRNS